MEVLRASHVQRASYVLPALVIVFSIPSASRLVASFRRVRTRDRAGLYEDKDGVATDESMARYSVRRFFVAIAVVGVVGLAVSCALAIYTTVTSQSVQDKPETWLLFASWAAALLQVLSTVQETEILKRYEGALFCSGSFLLIAILAGIRLFLELSESPRGIVSSVTLMIQVLSAGAVVLTFWSIPRRPDVFATDGRVVERQNQGSLLARYAFGWNLAVLDLAATRLVEESDFPAMDSHVRAKDVQSSFKSIVLKPTVSLWLQVFWAYRWQLFRQWALVSLGTFTDVGPQFAMLKLLQYLEARQGVDATDPKAWLWVGLLFIGSILETSVDYRIMWSMWSELGIPIRSTLSALLFEKLMRSKDCSDPPETEKSAPEDTKANDANKSTPVNSKASEKDAKKKETKGEKDVINMFAVDTNEVARFGAVSQFYVVFVSKLIVSIVFLWILVGWESLLAGLVAIGLVFPMNKILATRFSSYQKELMKARDAKTTIISEALQGIRQIKFLGIEPEWSEKINDVRDQELVKLWRTKVNNIFMMLWNNVAPIFLTIFSLSTYSYIHGDLLPSVAFTALSVFMQLESILGLLPFLFVMGASAKVSCDRIDSFLKSPDKPENTFPGESIVFDKVSVAFPSKSGTSEEATGNGDDGHDSETQRFVLRDLNLQFPNESLSVISGPTGSGKSLLLAAILGEVDVLAGIITVPRPPPVNERFDSKATAADWVIPSAMAFVAQTPWIENATIKDNILFRLPFDAVRYNKVIEACALRKDLDMFEDGDLTEVGAQGISLSGGQKWRLTLARAFYSRAGILVLDDVFSALDAHVGRHIFENALMGEIAAGRTRILVTHHVALCLPRAEYAVRLSARGTLEHAGLVNELKKSGSLEDIIKAESQENSEDHGQDQDLEETSSSGQADGSTNKDPMITPKKLVEEEKRETGSVKRSVYKTYLGATGGLAFWSFIFIFFVVAQGLTLSRSWWIKIWTASYQRHVQVSPVLYGYDMQTHFPSTGLNTTLVESNLMTSGVGVAGLLSTLSMFNFFSPHQQGHVSSEYAGTSAITGLSLVTPAGADTLRPSGIKLPIDTANRNLGFYLLGYVIISVVAAVVNAGRYYLVFRASLRASRKLFRDMTYRVLHTPLRWLDTVPVGRIMNRFTGDFNSLDSQLSSNFAQVGASFISIIGVIVAASVVSPYILVLAIVLFGICGSIALRYIRGARSIKRLESIQKSPMISHFASAVQGLGTIRAFASIDVFESHMHKLIDAYASASWHNFLFSNWVRFRMAMTGSMFSTLVAAFVVSTRGVDSSLGGFALAFALTYRQTVNQTLRTLTDTELDMNAAERIFEYSALEVEKDDGNEVRASWPEKGQLDVEDLEVGYAEDLPLILKGLSFHAEPSQRIGIVGRTGAGKSTLSLALFRFLQARKGHIVIDGVDISTIKLHDLRTRLTIIPQDPVLFSGTIRSNLDPFDRYSDQELREALQQVHLIPVADTIPSSEVATAERLNTSSLTIVDEPGISAESSTLGGSSVVGNAEAATKGNANIFLSLTSPIASGGNNLSQGQKQLLCLARAILSRPKLLLLDEATSAVDMKTDALIQRSIREEFSNTTLLVVAHRLNTVIDFDKILVMKDGVATEFGSPKELLAIEDGTFRGMIAQSGEREELEAKILGS